ncbi:DUF4350 domain-containing protein [uncultured Polaribacter sp.]|uniref:DUF4350 domain-containing protein n=1 Tax=uncultured Polaribacter sp. TaxID=174711 RepID=UPI00259AFA6B|nr:DUF4350 domain-containing protein [uncultured Polaribacter sp.]
MIDFYLFKKYTPLLLLFVLVSCGETDWRENFKEKEKTPFGNYIIYNEGKTLFKNQKITLLKENVYDYLLFDNDAEDSTIVRNYICIKYNQYKHTDDGINELLNFVKKGNNVFLAFNHFKDTLKTRLDFTTNNLDENAITVSSLKKLKGNFYFNHPKIDSSAFHFDRNIRRNYFLQYDNRKTSVLGTIEVGGEKVPNFIKIHHGKGAFYLHTQPVAFTNYFLLNNKESYVENVFSYLPDGNILWDPFIKSSKYSDKKEDNTSIFKFFLAHPTLTWFLFVSLIGLLLFMLFNARRKQRPVPVIEPLKNSTVAFTQTIANLYLKEEDHKNLVDKKISYFLEKVRTNYLLDTSNLNTDFIEKLALKSGNELQRTKYLVNTIITLHKKQECSEEELVVFYKMIKNFFKK